MEHCKSVIKCFVHLQTSTITVCVCFNDISTIIHRRNEAKATVTVRVVVKHWLLKDKHKDLGSEDQDEDKDLRSKDEDKDKDMGSEDEDKDLRSEDKDKDSKISNVEAPVK